VRDVDVYALGDELARLAARREVADKQLRDLLSLTHRALSGGLSVEDLVGHIKYQMARSQIDWDLGSKLCEALVELGGGREGLERFLTLLRHIVRLKPYYKVEPLISRAKEVEPKVQGLLRSVNYEGRRVDVADAYFELEDDELYLTVVAPSFKGDKGRLAGFLEELLRRRLPELRDLKFKVWIEG